MLPQLETNFNYLDANRGQLKINNLEAQIDKLGIQKREVQKQINTLESQTDYDVPPQTLKDLKDQLNSLSTKEDDLEKELAKLNKAMEPQLKELSDSLHPVKASYSPKKGKGMVLYHALLMNDKKKSYTVHMWYKNGVWEGEHPLTNKILSVQQSEMVRLATQ